MKPHRIAGALAAAVLVTLLGCSQESQTAPEPAAAPAPSPPEPTPTPAAAPPPDSGAMPAGVGDASRGAEKYALFCTPCHGMKGDGDGPLAVTLNPQPAKHSDGNYMNPLSNEYLFRAIKFGGMPLGKSPLMAPWAGTLKDEEILDVMAHVRTLANPPYQPAVALQP
jgi:cytochrome c553